MMAVQVRILLIITVALQFLFFRAKAQQDPVSALRKLYRDYPQEKIYIWFNKPEYVAGETIWFKGYVFSGYDVSLISTSLYVELYNAEKKLLATRLLPLFSGTAQGSIELDGKMDEDVYYIRAYTRWMLNFDEAFQYIKPVAVYNPASLKKLAQKKDKWTVRAVPEGGNLVEGLESKVAVRVLSPSSVPGKWTGYLYDESEPAVKIASFSSLDQNAAVFSFIPEARKKYMVHVNDVNGNIRVTPLPLVQHSGVCISLTAIRDTISYRLRFRNIPGNGNGYSIAGNVQHQPLYYAELKKTDEELDIKIPVASLHNGILHLTVFSPEKKPVAERLVFLNHSKLVTEKTGPVHSALSALPRSLNEITLRVDSLNWLSYAASVTDAEAPSGTENENILSSLWLTADLGSSVQNPASYFTEPDENKKAALDAILISEKWNRFSWTDILNNTFPAARFIPHAYLNYKGTVVKGNKLKPNENVNLILYYPDSSSHYIFSKTDSAGQLYFGNLAFAGDARIYYQLNSKKNSAKQIVINFERNNVFIPYSLALPESGFTLTAAAIRPPVWLIRAAEMITTEKIMDEKYKLLQEVVIRNKLKSAKEQLNEKLSSGMFRTIGEIVFDFINEEQNAIGFQTVLQWLGGRVAGLDIAFEDGETVAYIRGSLAALYLNEMPVDAAMLNSVAISDIALVKVIKGPMAFGLIGGSGSLQSGGGGGVGGVIAVYTAKGNMRPAGREPALPNNKIAGYDKTKSFFTPRYEDRFLPQPDRDTRDQLLWEPILPPTADIDKAKLIFYNNDRAKRVRITVQGMTESGFPVYFEKITELGPGQ